jgi:hypothetical protein
MYAMKKERQQSRNRLKVAPRRRWCKVVSQDSEEREEQDETGLEAGRTGKPEKTPKQSSEGLEARFRLGVFVLLHRQESGSYRMCLAN